MYNIGKLLMATGFGDLAGPLETIASGRKLARHSSGMGTVMEFNDGKPRRILVLDAKYRIDGKQFGAYGKDSSLTNYTSDPRDLNTSTNNSTTTTAAASISDSWINTNIVKDDNTAKQNCDVWMTYRNHTDSSNNITGVPAVEYCRSILVNGTPCDLPNIQTLARIYCDAEAIDARDPSKDTHPKLLLGSRNPGRCWTFGSSRFPNGVWSSTENSYMICWVVSSYGSVGHTGKSNGSAVIPVLEL